MKAEMIAGELGLSSAPDFDALTKRLAAMLRDGQLIQNRRGGYGVASKLDLMPGAVLANAEGYGFMRPDEGGDDLYLSPAEMRKVLHGDRVLASVVGVDRRGRRQGAIVEVLERRSPRLVGRVVEQNGVVLVTPDDRRLHQDVLITPGKDRGARSGQIVVAEITDQPTAQRGPVGRILAVLGERLTPSLVVEMAIASHGLPNEWPTATLREAADVDPEVSPGEIAERVDLRDVPLVTIDEPMRAISTTRSMPSRTRAGSAWSSRSPTCRITCDRAPRSTPKAMTARHRSIFRASSCRCCRRRSRTASVR